MSREQRLDLTLDEAQVIDLTRVLVDEDAAGALTWMRSVACSDSKSPRVKLDIILLGDAAYEFEKILEDAAAPEALRFLHNNLEDQLKVSRNPHCVPVFEACYKPNQAESYLTDSERE